MEILKKWKINEIKKKKNGKYLRISVPTLLDDDDLIKKVFKILTHPTAPAQPHATREGVYPVLLC